jgi:hypothetical protein
MLAPPRRTADRSVGRCPIDVNRETDSPRTGPFNPNRVQTENPLLARVYLSVRQSVNTTSPPVLKIPTPDFSIKFRTHGSLGEKAAQRNW